MPKRLFVVACILFLIAASLPAQKVMSSAVWEPKPAEWESIRKQCHDEQSSNYSSCLLAKLQGAAPPAAASFMKWLNAETNNVGWMTAFRETPATVGVASVMFPLRANSNAEWLIVNGQPAVIDIDNLQVLPTADMERSAGYQSMKNAHPNVTLFAGDRSGATGPKIDRLGRGLVRLIVEYPLRDGCHACAVLGTAKFGFDFSPAGHFLGSHFIGVEAQGPK